MDTDYGQVIQHEKKNPAEKHNTSGHWIDTRAV